MKKKWLAAGLAVAVIAAGGLAVGTATTKDTAGSPLARLLKFGKEDKKPAPAIEFAPREVVRPVLARLPTVIEFSGALVAPQTAVVRAKAGGTLVELKVGEGSRVAAGQTLGRIELPELASRLAERSALLESARTGLVQAERTHASNERLAQQNFISPIALENSRAALETARASLHAAQASLETMRVSLRDTVLVAPIAGIVARRHVLPGEKVSTEQQVLTLVDLATLELAGHVGTHEVSRLHAGMPVQVRVEGSDAPVTGRITRIAPATEPGTRSIGVTIALPNPKETMRAGQYAIARATIADDTARLTLPATAVGSTAGQDHIWVIEGGALARRAVVIGRRDAREGRVEVLEGATPASVVLAMRFDNLREGAKASVIADKTAPVASAAASMPALR